MDTGINLPDNNETRPKKRVLFVITQAEFGGAQRFFYDLITNLDRNKYEVLLASGKDGAINSFEIKGLATHKLNFLRRNVSPFSDLRAVWELRRLIKDYKPDTLFLNSSKAGFIGSLAARLVSCRLSLACLSGRKACLSGRQVACPKVIYRIGGWSFNDPRPSAERLLWIFLEWASAKWKDIIIINNKYDLEQADKFKIKPRDKIILVHNGLDVYKINLLPREEAQLKLFEKVSRQAGKIFQAEIIIGVIANLYPSKGLGYLIEAAEHFRNKDGIVFFIIGEGPDRIKLEELIIKRGLQKKIFLTGQIPDAHKLLGAFDIFVLPSVKEGFPWAVIEAMAAKLPVIATRVGAAPEIIEDGKNGFLVDPGRPEQIAARIQELLDDDHARQEFGIQAHQTVLFKFSLEKMIKEIESII